MKTILIDNPYFDGLKDIYIRDKRKELKISCDRERNLLMDIYGECTYESIDELTSSFYVSEEDAVFPYFKRLYDAILDSSVKKSIPTHWYSDNTDDERANFLNIQRERGGISFHFAKNRHDSMFGFGVVVKNHGSKNAPFHICFLQWYHDLQTIEDQKERSKVYQK